MCVLNNLRTNPEKTIESSYIYLNNTIASVEGCRVRISEKSIKSATEFSITPSESSNDYFFPYVQNYAGHVCVENPQNGTIVITPPMNGCALEVRYFKNSYTFYHDANGKCMGTVQCKGALCCRIDADAYWDNDEYDQYHGLAVPAVQFVCVHLEQKWYVGAFGIQLKPTSNGQQKVDDVFNPTGGRFRGCFNYMQFLTK